ncbi:hypothetical protein DRN73_08385 [Candidatus Pacearchaeota archaeon]|nr:MAG: hypothetical protein DRN73_08385 [Candidatus Pacearchaeota archaeon]
MLKNKQGISGIVLTIIMIGFVLVAAGIVWAVISNILQHQKGSIDISDKCMGIIINPTSLSCSGGVCNVTLERGLGSSTDEIGGAEVIVSDGTNSASSGKIDGDVVTSKKISITTDISATEADVKIYLKVEGEDKFCSQISSYP